MNLLLLYRTKCLPKNTNGRLAIPALAGLLVIGVLARQLRRSLTVCLRHRTQHRTANTERDVAMANPFTDASVCPSVRPTHADIEWKWLNILYKIFRHLV